ncbi:MAG: hypothetical protein FJ271_33500, partial [Planctomycetes bacterium]|nr:hypothetical protein [Planctomycetota bacterium]
MRRPLVQARSCCRVRESRTCFMPVARSTLLSSLARPRCTPPCASAAPHLGLATRCGSSSPAATRCCTGTVSSSMAETFDYVIVGGGTAGCVVANRLSADPRLRVLLLEAGGGDSDRWLHIPIGYARVFGKPEYNWIYQIQPEAQLNNRAGPFYQGKVIGGSSAVNGMIYLRGQREDFEHWVRLGCDGWDYDTVLK